ncbi:uncharacterized protein [Onthophagus taurus]
MDNKKVTPNVVGNPEPPQEPLGKHAHQHNLAPQHLRLLQYGLKIPNNQQYVHVHQHPQPIYSKYPQQYVHQHQPPKAQQPIYHTQPPPQPIYAQGPLTQQNAQVWVHYHQQKAEAQQQPPAKVVQPTIKSKENIDKKKSNNTHVQLRSPIAKRPPEAPVAMQGWLHKQGSEGLMLWKKRWFVLSEYCLFYYKGPEEEKLLGSVLLPSYKVSICGPEDKITRKHAFKCEHTNMRTYVLSADSQDLMMQWVRVLNLACLLQSTVDLDQSVQSASTYVNSGENSDSGFFQQSSQTIRNTPVHMHTSSNTTDLSSPSQEASQYNQPLYANAPPKPRRLNDAGYSSPSPEILDRYHAEPKYISPPFQYLTPPRNAKSPLTIYTPPEYVQQISSKGINDYGVREYVVQNVERRTPDTYGRSKTNNAKDYEDIYAEQYMYKRPLSPLAYSSVKKSNPTIPAMQRTYTPVSMLGPRDISQFVPQQRKSPCNIPRPHSADFLEYEVNHRQPTRQQRPKSSLDINRNTSSDNYFYSEERYAEKMRKSAQYLPNMPRYIQQPQPQPKRIDMDKTFPLMKSNTQPINFTSTPVEYQRTEQQQQQPIRSRSVLSEGSLSKEFEDIRTSPRPRYDQGSLSPWQNRPDQIYGYSDDSRVREQFNRSASARLTQNSSVQTERGSVEGRINREGERKREESMKRLLEWKQRMLQSPLNRKVHQNLNRPYPPMGKDPSYFKSLEYQKMDPYMDPRVAAAMQYNSYSSDDEEQVDSTKESVQAGWTADSRLSDVSLAPISTVTFTAPSPALHGPDAPSTTESTTIDGDVLTQPHYNKESSTVAHVSSLRLDYDKSNTTDIKSNGALVKSILAEFENKNSENIELTENIDETKTPTRDVELSATNVIEENYMTMTPKKNILDPATSNEALTLETDENPYVEMTQGSDLCLLNQQPYEMVCFGKSEPVYMELHPTRDILNIDDPKKLPDILMLSKKKSSDSSDADDEASKDLDSLDTPSHPRFSLSDSFRPASYYLGATQTAPELQDSSDSELVSPPPIPRSPPPLDELDERSSAQEFSLTDEQKDEFTFSKFSKSHNRDGDSSSLSHNSDSDVELRTPGLRAYERMLKRRPVSEEFCGELDSLDSRYNETIDSVDLDKYLRDLQVSNVEHDYENMCIVSQRTPESSKPSVCHSRQNSRDTHDSSRSLLTPDYIHRRAESSASITEINSIHNSRLSTPVTMNRSAPYYYSDLSMNTTDSNSTILTLNNQRGNMINKRDITHIVNPIRCSNTRTSRNVGRNSRQNLIDNTFKLAAEARSVSVDFLNLTDKSGQIDKKNIYESDTLKRLKAIDSITSLQSNPETRNLFPSTPNEKFHDLDPPSSSVRRSHSLEGLLENVLSENVDANEIESPNDEGRNAIAEGSYMWEEDAIWRERLRTASQRHTKSLDDLDCIGETKKDKHKKQPRGIMRGVTYVNDNVYNMPIQCKQQKDTENQKPGDSRKENFIIDREKLRQWDLMSSAPSDTQSQQGITVGVVAVDVGDETSATLGQSTTSQEQASGSICINSRDTVPRALSAKQMWNPNSQSIPSRSITNLTREHENEYGLSIRQQHFMGHHKHHDGNSGQKVPRQGNWHWGEKMNVSAGELLGRTHEELVLLLIQLRRQSTNTYNAIEACYTEIENIQGQLHRMDPAKQLENLQKLEQIKQHLLELEKQYEKGKPLVNLVDNMVKLGSLYRSPNDRNINPYVRDRLEFNQQIQERRLLAEERRDWNRLNPNHMQLQEKVQQLYQLDRLIQEESGTLQGLQHDKEEIERALGGLRHRLHKGFKDPAEVEQARKQQAILENELSRVHLMLAQNSKKLEETVAGNARLEQELLVLKQKLQISRQQRSSPQFSNAGDSLPCVVGTSAMLESDLQRVQQKVGDLQRQRQELSMQVRQLTDRSNNLQQQIKPLSANSSANYQGNKKKIHSLWRETDLDTMNIIDHGESWENSTSSLSSAPTTPLYINTDLKQAPEMEFYNNRLKTSDSTSEDTTQGSGLMPQERPEIKTVRIVKRESERRQRDREKTSTGKWDPLLEEDASSQSSGTIFRPGVVQKTQSTTNIGSPGFETDKTSSGVLSRQSSLSSPSLPQGFSDIRATSSEGSVDKSPELSPVFQSEAARQIITEMSQETVPKQLNRRAVPKEKRRHYTAPNNNLIMKSLNQLPTDDSFDKLTERRARDDLDMERALRQRIDAPDVVRSTLSNKELKYNENTIDNILGTPNKINIPERYIPEQLPKLSAEEEEHRLRKVESIKKMLSDTTIISTSSPNLATEDSKSETPSSSIVNKATTKMIEEKKQREHLLQLNQILAKQVMEMSKIVAVKALANLPLEEQQDDLADDEDLSPVMPLPIYQQRYNFYS